MTLNEKRPLRPFRVVGIHLAGSQSSHSAIVRGVMNASGSWSGLNGWRHDRMAPVLTQWTGIQEPLADLPPQFDGRDGVSSFVIEAFLDGLGPEKDRDADSVLIQALSDLGAADFYVIDQALELPPCLDCSRACPGVSACEVPQVVEMRTFWESQRKQGKRLRSPQPYMDRFIDLYARHVLTAHQGLLATEFESPAGSNRAPLLARARHVLRRLCSALSIPRERVFETQSLVSAVTWMQSAERSSSLAKGKSSIYPPSQFKRPFAGRIKRREVWNYLVNTGRLSLGANLPARFAKSLCDDPELFFAAMSGLNVRELFAGGIFMQDEYLAVPEVLTTLPLLPRNAGHFIDGSSETRTDLK